MAVRLNIGDMNSLDMAFSELDFDDLEECIDRFQTDPLIKNILEKESNLREFIEDNDKQLNSVQEQAILDTVASAESLASLHQEISTCETILASFEEEIRGFRAELTETAREMKSLRGRTMTVGQQAKNRAELAVRLHDIEEKLHIPDSLLAAIANGKINEEYMKNLMQLDQHITYIKEYGLLESSNTRQEVWPKIEEAVNKVSSRLQVHISQQLQQLQVENTNVGIVQQAIAKSCGFANFFVGQHSEEMYLTICADYKETMGRVYLTHAKTHLKDLHKMEAANVSKGLKKPDMGLIVPKDMFDAKRGKESGEKKFSFDKITGVAKQIQTLGRKEYEAELKDRLHSIMAVEVVEDQIFLDPSILDKGRTAHLWCDTFFQALIRIANQMITEKKFVKAFFHGVVKKQDEIIEGAFGKACALLTDTLKKSLDEYPADVWGAIIAARGVDIVSTYFGINKGLGNAYADTQFQQWNELLKTRVIHLLSTNLRTVKEVNLITLQPHRFHFKHSVAEAISTDSALAAQLAIHAVVQNYAEIAGELHYLNTIPIKFSRVPLVEVGGVAMSPVRDYGPTLARRPIFADYVQTSLSTILFEELKFITALARRHQNVTLQNIFYINNYSAILSAWNYLGVPSDIADYVEVQKRQLDVIDQFVHQEFQSSMFGKVVEFVTRYEPLVRIVNVVSDNSNTEPVGPDVYQANQEVVNAQEMETLVLNFNKSWQAGLASLKDAVTKYFKDSSVSTQVLRVFFAKIIDANQRLRTLVLSCFANPPFRTKLVLNQNIAHEIATKYVIQMEES